MASESEKFNPEKTFEVDQEAIEKLEQLRVGMDQAAGLILVKLGLKPAIELDLFEWNDKPDEVEKILDEAGLVFVRKAIDSTQDKRVAYYSIARDNETVKTLAKLEPSKDHEEYGRLMGYPETAIAVFHNQKEKLGVDELPNTKDLVFRFMLSKSHWQDEVKVLEGWSQALKVVAPDLYTRLRGKDGQHDHFETTRVGSSLYDVEKLKEYEKNIPETEMPLEELAGAVSEGNFYWFDSTGGQLSPHQILQDWEVAQKNEAWQYHVDSIKRADLDQPIWITSDGHVFDGVHRLTRAFLEKKDSIKVKIWDQLPESAIVKE